MDLIQTNKYQTKLTDELKASLSEDIWSDMLDYIESVPFISWLISTENVRGYAKDRPKKKYINEDNELIEYPDGRIDVDITHPHILENMDYFRGPAIHFQKFKKYTNITPNKNRKSEYGMFWANEQYKWKYGVVRESDGEWIPGYYYFYLNYSPIFRNKAISNASGKKKAERVYDFPDVFLGDYMFFHYLDQAHDSGGHAKVLKARGIGGAGPLSEKILTPDGFKTYGDINIGDYLIGRDGLKTLVTDKFPQGVVDIYEVEFMDGRKTRCTLNHNWTIYDKSSKYKNELKVYNLEKIINKGLYNVNKNGNKLYKFFIPFISPVKYEEKSLPIGPYALGALLGDGSMSTKDLKIASCDSDSNEFLTYFHESLGDGYHIVKYKGDNINFRIYDHELTDSILWHGGINPKGSSRLKKSLRELKLDVNTNGKFIPDIYKYSSIEQRLELIKGLMDTDGSINTDGSMEFSNSNYRLISDVAEVLRSLGIYCNLGLGRNPHQKEMFGKTCNIKQEYRLYISSNESLFKLKRKLNRVKKAERRTSIAIVNIKKLDYQEDAVCFSVDNSERMYLTTDYIPTHNSYKMSAIGTCNMFIYKGLPNFYLASDKTFLEDDKGVFGKVIKTLDWVGINCPLPKLRLVDQPLNIKLGYTDEFGHEKGILSSVFGISLMNQPNKARGIRGKLILYEEDGLFPNLETAWNVNRDAVEDGDLTFGLMMALGTGGTTGSSFEASERFFYKPEAYNIYGIPNVFDKGSDGTTKVGFFWPAYLNRAECYDVPTGEPDVIKSLIKILSDRYKIKYNSEISGTLTQRMAEQPIVPQEAVMRTSGNIFPVSDIKYTIGNLMVSESYYSTHFVGNIVLHPGGKLEFKEDYSLNPIRKYPTPNGQKNGAIEIFEKPINEQGKDRPKWGRYVAGIDPIDFDSNTYTDSLGCILILDTLKDTIVAEYTGRPMLAEEFYETCRLLLIMYNAQANYGNKTRGMFPYFRNKGSLHLLCDIPEILFDKELTKTSKFGNNAKGTVENPGVIAFGNGLIREWLLTESFYQEYNDDNEQKSTYLNVHKIRSKALLEELAAYDSTGNFDRVAALRLLMILKAQVAPVTASSTKYTQEQSSYDVTFNNYWNKIGGKINKSYIGSNFNNIGISN